MSTKNTFQYPNINLPPIVYQNERKGEKLEFADIDTPFLMGHSNTSTLSGSGSTRQTTLSFVPSGFNGSLVPMEGDMHHPEQHLLTNSEFVSPSRTQVVIPPPKVEAPTQEELHEKEQKEQAKRGYTPITHTDEEVMKFYVAGMGVVSLLILYKIMY